jgi:hypothetical protein
MILVLLLTGLLHASEHLNLVFTATNRGELRPCGCPGSIYGGLAKRASLLDEIRQKKGDFILVDAGDALFPAQEINEYNRIPREEKAKGVLLVMEMMRYDLMLFTPKDLDRMSSKLLDHVQNLDLYHQTETTIKFDLSDIRIAHLPDKNNNKDKLTIYLTGLTDEEISRELRNDDKVLLIISSSTADTLANPVLSWVDDVPVIRPTAKGKEIGFVSIDLDKKYSTPNNQEFVRDLNINRWVISSKDKRILLELHKIPRETKDNEEIDNLLEIIEFKASSAMKTEPWQEWAGQMYPGVGACVACHTAQVERWEKTGHARAYATLEADNNENNIDCIACHSTGYGVSGGFQQAKSVGHLQDVQCEVCHGASIQHIYNPGISPPILTPSIDVCKKCHQSDRTKASWDYPSALQASKCLTDVDNE